MKSEVVTVFFYGLFMDESVLASKGVSTSKATVGYVNGCSLRIGRRATLVPDDGNRAYGVVTVGTGYGPARALPARGQGETSRHLGCPSEWQLADYFSF